jgi:hypothetical protein
MADEWVHCRGWHAAADMKDIDVKAWLLTSPNKPGLCKGEIDPIVITFLWADFTALVSFRFLFRARFAAACYCHTQVRSR